MKLTTRDKQRLQHVNDIMNDIHESVNMVYESLVDEEYETLRKDLKKTIAILSNLLEAVEDEI